MITTPILNSIAPFDATKPLIVTFNSIGGNQVFRHQIVITDIEGNAVYTQERTSFMLKHEVPKDTMINGNRYIFTIRTSDVASGDSWSDYSEAVIGYAMKDPVLTIDNIDIDGVVKNQSYEFNATYVQEDTEDLISYFSFELFDGNGIFIKSSGNIFSDRLAYTFDGLQNHTDYMIAVTVTTKRGLRFSSEKYFFHVEYVQPLIENDIHLMNVPEIGAVRIATQIIRLVFEIGEGEISYEEGTWVNLKNGMIYMEDGFNPSVREGYTTRMWFKDIEPYKPCLILYSNLGRVELILEKDREDDNLYQMVLYTISNRGHKKLSFSRPFHYFSNAPYYIHMEFTDRYSIIIDIEQTDGKTIVDDMSGTSYSGQILSSEYDQKI